MTLREILGSGFVYFGLFWIADCEYIGLPLTIAGVVMLLIDSGRKSGED